MRRHFLLPCADDARPNGGEETVEIKTIEAGAAVRIANLGVVGAEPLDHCEYFVIPPHPGRESREGLPLLLTRRSEAHILFDSRGIRPVGLDGHGIDPPRAGSALW